MPKTPEISDKANGSLPVFKKPRALSLWLAVLFCVLAVLWLEIRGNSDKDYNLCLNGDSDTIGAAVFVDRKQVGYMGDEGGSAMGGGAFWTKLPDGKHEIEVRKAGFNTFHQEYQLRGQGYIGVVLKAEGAGKDQGDAASEDFPL